MLHSLDIQEGREVRDFFHAAGYTTPNLQKHFGSIDTPHLELIKLLDARTQFEPSRLSALFRWFWIGAPVSALEAAEFIPARLIDLFLKAGLVTQEKDTLESTVRICPFAGYLVASDHAMARTGALRTDTVVWPNPTTLLTHHLSIQSPVGRTLDLGSGCGILAIAAAHHSSRVIATDLNPRARAFCLFNAALNGVENLEFIQGSAFEPVRDQRFDLILSNPPFFVTPSVRRVYSDNGMELDGFCRMLIRDAPQHLNPNGYCQIVMEWVGLRGQPWRERLAEWFDGLGCDVQVLATYVRQAAAYAMIRVRETCDDLRTPEDQAPVTAEWQSYFESKNVEAIYGGVVVLRKREGRNWIRMDELAGSLARPFGESLRRVFENRDFLERHSSDEDLLATRPILSSSARLQKQFEISPAGWKLASVELRLSEGLPYSLVLQSQVSDFLGLLDGNRTLLELADRFAAALGADPSLMRRECCVVIRNLADRAMLHWSAHQGL